MTTPGRLCRFPLLEKKSEGPSYPFRLFQCSLVAGSKPFFAAYRAVILSLKWKLFMSLITTELFCFSANSKLFLPGFLSLIALLQATGVVCRRTSILEQLVRFLLSHDRLASSCLVAAPAFKIISRAKHYRSLQDPPSYLLLYLKLFLSLVVLLWTVSNLFLSLIASLRAILSPHRYSTLFLLLITWLRAVSLFSYFLNWSQLHSELFYPCC